MPVPFHRLLAGVGDKVRCINIVSLFDGHNAVNLGPRRVPIACRLKGTNVLLGCTAVREGWKARANFRVTVGPVPRSVAVSASGRDPSLSAANRNSPSQCLVGP